MDSEGIVSLDDAAKIGIKIVEMADRAKVGSKYMPGAETKWWFEIDGTRFVVKVALSTDRGERDDG